MIERMVDLAAAELKMDPAELRRKNYIPPQSMPFKTSLTFTYDCGEFEKGMDLALKLADVDGFDIERQSCPDGRGGGALQSIRLAAVEHDGGAGFGQAAGNGEAKAAIRAGDQSDATIETECFG